MKLVYNSDIYFWYIFDFRTLFYLNNITILNTAPASRSKGVFTLESFPFRQTYTFKTEREETFNHGPANQSHEWLLSLESQFWDDELGYKYVIKS